MSTTSPRFFDATDDGAVADELGKLRAEIDTLRNSAEFLEGLLKHKGVTEAESALFRVRITYGIETKRVSWKDVAAKLNPSRQLVQAHTRISTSDRVLVTAKRK
jgi:hypothetical protein